MYHINQTEKRPDSIMYCARSIDHLTALETNINTNININTSPAC